MAHIIKESEHKVNVWYERVFDYEGEPGCGYGFPCDKDGNLSPDLLDVAYDNYKKCLAGVEHNGKKLIDKGVVKYEQGYREPAQLKCNCGEVISLVNEYLGACSCPKCGQWYSLSGQELLPPKMWEENY